MNNLGEQLQRLTLGLSPRFRDASVEPFPQTPLETSRDPFEQDLLRTLSTRRSALTLFRSVMQECFYYGDGIIPLRTEKPVYRLVKANYGHLDFEVCFHRLFGSEARVILVVVPEAQGNFFKLKEFVNKISDLLFNLNNHFIARLVGTAQSNPFPLKNKTRDWRNDSTRNGTNKLVALYYHLGAVSNEIRPKEVSLFNPLAKAMLLKLAAERNRRFFTPRRNKNGY